MWVENENDQFNDEDEDYMRSSSRWPWSEDLDPELKKKFCESCPLQIKEDPMWGEHCVRCGSCHPMQPKICRHIMLNSKGSDPMPEELLEVLKHISNRLDEIAVVIDKDSEKKIDDKSLDSEQVQILKKLANKICPQPTENITSQDWIQLMYLAKLMESCIK